MSTYSGNATLHTGFRNVNYSWGDDWSSVEYSSTYDSGGWLGTVCRRENNDYFFTSLTFGSNITSCYGKHISSITLTVNFSDTDSDGKVRLRFKYGSSTRDFTSSNSAQTSSGSYDLKTATVDVSQIKWTDLASMGVPRYGYVIGPYTTSNTNNWIRISSASISIVTVNHTYKVTFNSNGSSDTFSDLSYSDESTGTSHTFTIPSNYTPTRSGYTFLGWGTSQSSTSASYSPGSTITVSRGSNTNQTVTLYAVWEAKATLRIVNNNALDTYFVYIINSSNNLEMYRVMIVNSSGNALEPYY